MDKKKSQEPKLPHENSIDLISVKEIVLSNPVSNPVKTRAIAEARIKTDKIDSETLVHLLRTDLIPSPYIPKREIRDMREIFTL